MDPKRHRAITVLIGIIFLFAVLTNVLIIHPFVYEVTLAAVLLILLIGLAVWGVRKYKQRFY